jgi:heme exporter protein D
VSALRDRLVLAYIGLAVLALVPGLAVAFQVSPETIPGLGGLVVALRESLADIRFGSGLRFWLGVIGAAMLGLLLLYPLRKVFFKTRVPGSVGSWFHIHILLGLIGPVLILYHANFGLGGFNANVALWSMLAITVSGVVGFFVYSRVSRDYYLTNERARQHRKALIAALPDHGDALAWKAGLTSEMEAFEADILKPRQGVIASLRARLRLEQRRRPIVHMIAGYIEEHAQARKLTSDEHRQLRAISGWHVRAYFALAQSSMSQSIREQLWARWRLFHMPLFVIMVGAVVLHVIAVWGMESPAESSASLSATANRAIPVPNNDLIGDLLARAFEGKADPPALPPVLIVKPQRVTKRPSAIQASTPPEASRSANLVSRPRPPVSARAFDNPLETVAGAGEESSPTNTDTKMAPVFAELQKRMQSQPMGLGIGAGGTLPAKLDDQIVHMKALMRAGQFTHSEAETGFALTGKHLKAECTSCHKAPLREVAFSTAPRQCLTCHTADDIHKGRRPDCANCHTTNRWTQILKRK